jgi:hypothetical protein
MNALYGLANTSINTAYGFYTNLKAKAEKKGKPFPKLKIIELDSAKVLDNQIVFVPSVALFLNKRRLLNKTKSTIYVFDCAVQCEYLNPIVILDLDTKLDSYCYRFKKITERDFEASLKKSNKIEVVKTDIQIIPELIGNISQSILSPVMKFLYCVPNPMDRNKYSTEIARWFFSSKDLAYLEKRLYKTVNANNHFAVEDLIKFFSTPEGKKLKKVASELDETTPRPARVREIAKKYDVKDYEILYIASLYKKSAEVRHLNKTSKEIDLELRTRYAA